MRNNKYVKVLQLGMQNEMEYRANYWLQMAGFMLPIMTQIFLWLAVFGSSGQATILCQKCWCMWSWRESLEN
ncbi:hypothetical protein [Paenibacillus polymyxa]|uniref:hypothetical protein n=1 Tax=Paenibacillus polymyxa TaxID=1406 RepID=UPI000415C061|nr:hypothetical protein [Paenibacillus polymyxa]